MKRFLTSELNDEYLQQAREIAEQLCRGNPKSDRYARLLAEVLIEQRHHRQPLDEQLEKLKAAQKLWEEVISRNPRNNAYRFGLAKVLGEIADAYYVHYDYPTGDEANNKALGILRELVAEEPTNLDFAYELANCLKEKCGWMCEEGKFDQAFAAITDAMALSSQLVRVDHESRKYLTLHARNKQLSGLSKRFQVPGDLAGAKQDLQSAIDIARGVLIKYPNDAEALNYLAMYLNDYAHTIGESDSETALSYSREAVATVERLAQRYPDSNAGAIAVMRQLLIDILYQTKRYAECISISETHENFLKSQMENYADDPMFEGRLILVLEKKARSQESLGLNSDAELTYRRAFDNSIGFAKKGTAPAQAVNQLVEVSFSNLTTFLRKERKVNELCEAYERLIEFLKDRNELSTAFLEMGNYSEFLVEIGRYEAAVEWGEQAIDGMLKLTKNQQSTEMFQQAILACRLVRAKALCMLKKTDEADAEWKSLLDTSDEEGKNAIRSERVLARFDSGLVPNALSEINELVRTATLPSATWYAFSLRYAQAASESIGQSDLYRKRSLAILQKAADVGFASPASLESNVFDAVREFPGFQKASAHVESNALYTIASQKLISGDYAGSIADYDRVLELNPDKAIVFNDRGWAKQNIGDDRGALLDYGQSIARLQNFEGAYFNKAFLLATTNDDSLRNGAIALELAEKGIEIKSSGFGLNAKSCALAALGKFEEAIQYQSIAMQDPQWMEAKGIDGGGLASDRIKAWEARELWHPLSLTPTDLAQP